MWKTGSFFGNCKCRVTNGSGQRKPDMKQKDSRSLPFAPCSRFARPPRRSSQRKSPDRIPECCVHFRYRGRIEAFRHGLRELGYVEGKNIVVEWRSADGKPDRLPALAAELVRLKVDVIVTAGPPATRAAKEATVYDSHCHDAGFAILLETGSSPALRGLAETLLDCQPLPRR